MTQDELKKAVGYGRHFSMYGPAPLWALVRAQRTRFIDALGTMKMARLKARGCSSGRLDCSEKNSKTYRQFVMCLLISNEVNAEHLCHDGADEINGHMQEPVRRRRSINP
ncbi:hypothetical protein KCP70_06710 [Salmonella enterica subsp. enterica]|nr:hypothetical protein KCP70_06710 [Salmonella enterica subsp. enterica]